MAQIIILPAEIIYNVHQRCKIISTYMHDTILSWQAHDQLPWIWLSLTHIWRHEFELNNIHRRSLLRRYDNNIIINFLHLFDLPWASHLDVRSPTFLEKPANLRLCACAYVTYVTITRVDRIIIAPAWPTCATVVYPRTYCVVVK